MSESTHLALEQSFRDDYGRLIGYLSRLSGDLSLAEDAMQDAYAAALNTWPVSGEPSNPSGWLLTTARNRILDTLRRLRHQDRDAESRLAQARAETQVIDLRALPDDRLTMMLHIARPELKPEAQLSLILKVVAGFGVEEIGRALLADPKTIAQRIVRAKRTLRELGAQFDDVPPHLVAERLPMIHQVIYLIFNEGYSATLGDDLIREALCREGIQLVRIVLASSAANDETRGLMALMAFHTARLSTRVDSAGNLVLLRDQDRNRWDRDLLDEASSELETVRGLAGPYVLQARLAACHALAPTWDETPWQEVIRLYRLLQTASPSPVVLLNMAAALVMNQEAPEALSLLESLASEASMQRHHLYHATLAECHVQLGNRQAALGAFQTAYNLAQTRAERQFLQERLAELSV